MEARRAVPVTAAMGPGRGVCPFLWCGCSCRDQIQVPTATPASVQLGRGGHSWVPGAGPCGPGAPRRGFHSHTGRTRIAALVLGRL